MVAKCFPETAPDDPNHSLFHSGELTLKAHQVGFIVSGIFTVLAFIITTWHVRKHCLFYTSPRHQRYIIRILLMCPFYAILSFLSYFWWKESLYFELVRDSYEALVIASFFYLILECAGANTVELAISLKNCDFHKWLWPLGKIRRVPRPWTMLMICKIGVLQYASLL
jgi:heme/copper-type cytochrome/quinol oxidase subunit 4